MEIYKKTEHGKGKITFYNELTDSLEEDLDYNCSVYQK